MDTMEKFCLKWNDFENNIRDSFRELRKDQDNFDVTLATDDGHTIQSHKIILSAGSKFFSNILRQTKLNLNMFWISCTMVRLLWLRKN